MNIEQRVARLEARAGIRELVAHYCFTIDARDTDAGRASGIVNSHAEVVRNHEAMWASLRYHDEYAFEEGRRRFRDRSLAFFYYLRPLDYQDVMKDPLRNRANASPHPADFPEGLTTWQDYYRERPHSQG